MPGTTALELRWEAHARRLADLGAPQEVVDAAGAAAVSPTGRPGPAGRLVVADARGVALDLVLPEPPVREATTWGPVPHLMPAVRAFPAATSYALVEVDGAGADLLVVGARGEPLDAQTVEGGHDILHKVPGGGWAHRRLQMRVEDSIERNADVVAARIWDEVRRHDPDVVLLAGEDKPAAAVLGSVAVQVRARVVRLRHGGRAAGVDARARDDEISQVLAEIERDRRAALLDRFASAQSRQQEAVEGLDAVLEVLQRQQVDELLLHDDPSSDRALQATGIPGQLAQDRADLLGMGARDDDIAEVRADAAIVWALVGSGAGITLLAEDDPPLPDGVAALLRYSDVSTPHDAAPSMPGHGEPPGM